MNKNQKLTIFGSLSFIIIAFGVWAIQGFHLFTHDKIEIQLPQSDVDKLLGQPPRYSWVNHFTLGLEYTAAFTAIIVLLASILFFIFKNKKKVY